LPARRHRRCASSHSRRAATAEGLRKEKIAHARLKTEYPKLTPTQFAEVDGLAVAAVEAEAGALAQPIDVALRADLLPFERTVRTSVTSTLSQHEFDALVSFAFNVGAGGVCRSAGRVLPGLTTRRAARQIAFSLGRARRPQHYR
jgi:hypothetical protein